MSDPVHTSETPTEPRLCRALFYIEGQGGYHCQRPEGHPRVGAFNGHASQPDPQVRLFTLEVDGIEQVRHATWETVVGMADAMGPANIKITEYDGTQGGVAR